MNEENQKKHILVIKKETKTNLKSIISKLEEEFDTRITYNNLVKAMLILTYNHMDEFRKNVKDVVNK